MCDIEFMGKWADYCMKCNKKRTSKSSVVGVYKEVGITSSGALKDKYFGRNEEKEVVQLRIENDQLLKRMTEMKAYIDRLEKRCHSFAKKVQRYRDRGIDLS